MLYLFSRLEGPSAFLAYYISTLDLGQHVLGSLLWSVFYLWGENQIEMRKLLEEILFDSMSKAGLEAAQKIVPTITPGSELLFAI